MAEQQPVPEPGDLVWIDEKVAYVPHGHWMRVAYVEHTHRADLDDWVFLSGYPVTRLGVSASLIVRFVCLRGLVIRRPDCR